MSKSIVNILSFKIAHNQLIAIKGHNSLQSCVDYEAFIYDGDHDQIKVVHAVLMYWCSSACALDFNGRALGNTWSCN